MVLVFNQHFPGEDWGSKIYSELFALVHPAWLWELTPFQGFRGLEMGACVLEGNAVSSGLGTFFASVQHFPGSG